MLEQYIEEHSAVGTAAEKGLLAELDRATNQRVIQPKMVSGCVQAAFLTLITKILQPQFVLEIGTFTGYSALAMAAGLGEGSEEAAEPHTGQGEGAGQWKEAEFRTGKECGTGCEKAAPQLHTIEIDDELEDLAREFFDRSPHGRKIQLHIGNALQIVPELARRLRETTGGRFEGFDMVFIDGDKREYPAYYQMLMGKLPDVDGTQNEQGAGMVTESGMSAENITTVESGMGNVEGAWAEALPMVRVGGVILADNVLWYGKVADQPAIADAKNRTIADDPGGQKTDTESAGTGMSEADRDSAGAKNRMGTGAGNAGAGRAETSTESAGAKSDRQTAAIRKFNRMVAEDPRVENVILPLRDGVNLIRVTKTR